MDESMDYTPEEGYTEEPVLDDASVSEETGVEADPSDQGDIEGRIDDLLDQIGAGQSYGSMGDYYVAEAGCYAFPGEDVLYYFIAEGDRSGWAAASNGCYVPAGSLDAYEACLASGTPEEDMEGEGEEPLPPPVTQEDLSGLEEALQAIHGEDAAFYETAILHMETTEKALEHMQSQFFDILLVHMGTCLFLALLCGVIMADVFWKRMRAG